jgi:hypothetical protein
MRTSVPDEIENKMKAWRNGLAPFPKEYIEFHKGLAEKALLGLKAEGYVVHREYMDSDGWADGMRVLFVIAEKDGEVMKLHWHDGNQEFFFQSPRSGSWPLKRDKAPAS